jgi:pimeloyl-ACP methyl ester carboxylesterase
MFAHLHPQYVAGLVFVDATHEVIESRGLVLLPAMYFAMGLFTRTKTGRRWLLRQVCPEGSPPAYRARMEERIGDSARRAGGNRTVRAEGAGIRPSLAALRRDCPTLPAVPVHVLTAGGISGPNVKSVRRVHEAWRTAVAQAPRARYTNIPTSGHFMPIEAAPVVVDAIYGVLDDVSGQ